jgi:Transposase, Mutator family
MERLSAPARTREELRALMNGDLGTAAGRGDLVHLALRLIVEEALEGEVSDVLGRERYERGEGEKAGYRNGYRPGKMKTAEGAVDYSAPQVRDTQSQESYEMLVSLGGSEVSSGHSNGCLLLIASAIGYAEAVAVGTTRKLKSK